MQRDSHLVAGRLDLVDRTDPHTHDLDFVSWVQRERLREIRDHGSGSQFPVEPRAGRSGHDRQDHHQPADDHYLCRQFRQSQAADVEDGAHWLLPPVPSGNGSSGWVRAPGGAFGGSGIGMPGTAGAGSPGRPALRMPGVGGGPSGLGGDGWTSSGAGKSGPPNGPTVAPAQGSGVSGRGNAPAAGV